MRTNEMTVEQARELLRTGKRLRIRVGPGPDDPTIVLSLFEGMVMCSSVAGWSAGVVEPACSLESDYLRTYFETSRPMEVLEAQDDGWRTSESEFEAQSARDAEWMNYGGESYWRYLDEAARGARDYYLRHDDPEKAAEMMTRSLADALRGNDGV